MNSFPLMYNLETFNGTPGFQLHCMGWSGGAMVLGLSDNILTRIIF